MSTSGLYCAKCRAELAHLIARFKADPADYRRVSVIGMTSGGKVRCKCQTCGHVWDSRSAEARRIAEKQLSRPPDR